MVEQVRRRDQRSNRSSSPSSSGWVTNDNDTTYNAETTQDGHKGRKFLFVTLLFFSKRASVEHRKKQLLLMSLVVIAVLLLLSLRVFLLSWIDDWKENRLSPAEKADQQILFCGGNETTTTREVTTIFKGNKPEHSFDGCFVSSIFGVSRAATDRPIDISSLRKDYPNYEFLMFTNLVNLQVETRGWRKVLHFDTSKKRMITISRYPKFFSWKEEFIQKYCPVVFYMDGVSFPNATVGEFDRLRYEILQSEVGFAQRIHVSLEKELHDIVNFTKDTRENIDATRDWIRTQSDFASWEDPHVYRNTYFGYNPKSTTFQKASQFFWDVYSKEQLSWRDQPLWGYTLHHFNLKPLSFGKYTFGEDHSGLSVVKGGHQYDASVDTEVQLFLSAVRWRVCREVEEKLRKRKAAGAAITKKL